MPPISVILFGATILIYVIKWIFYKPKNFPPGPPRIPFLGSYVFLLLLNYHQLQKATVWLSKFYKSSIIGLYLGPYLTVICNDHENVKNVLNDPDYDGRPDVYIGRLRDPDRENRGIIFLEGDIWRDQRRFFMRHLRDMGFGRRFTELELFIRDEIIQFLNTIKSGPKYPHEFGVLKNDGHILLPNAFFGPTINGFVKVLSGITFPREEQEPLFNTGHHAMLVHKNLDSFGRLISFIPWIVNFFPNLSGYNALLESNPVIYDFIKSIVDKHMELYNEGSSGQTVLDLYIQRMKEEEKKGIKDSSFQYKQLIVGIVDIYFAAVTTIPTQLSFLMMRFLENPEITLKIQREMDEIVGGGRLPELDDRQNLPYTEAVIREALRFNSIVPNAVPHKAMIDKKLAGYDLPAGTFVFTNVEAANWDEKIWTDPENFRPERFLDANGQLNLKLDPSLPFGGGKRLCAGETFARNTLFLYITAIFQNFNVKKSEFSKVPTYKELKSGLITHFSEFWLQLTPR